MDSAKRHAIEAAGWKVGDAADFLEMSAEERQLLDTRVEIARAVRSLREAAKMTQVQLGKMLKTSQPRVAKIERAAPDVSLDQLVRALAVAGGKIVVRTATQKVAKGKRPAAKTSAIILEVTASKQ